MGLDGGSISKRPDIVNESNRRKEIQEAREEQSLQNESYIKTCALTSQKLQNPIIMGENGLLFNKEAVYEAIINKTLPQALRYLKKVSKHINIQLLGHKELINYSCPVSKAILTVATYANFSVLKTCGHVFLTEALQEIEARECPVCGEVFSVNDVIRLCKR